MTRKNLHQKQGGVFIDVVAERPFEIDRPPDRDHSESSVPSGRFAPSES